MSHSAPLICAQGSPMASSARQALTAFKLVTLASLAVQGFVLGSCVTAYAQSNEKNMSTSPGTSKVEICETPYHRSPRELSLTLEKESKVESEVSVSEERRVTTNDPDGLKREQAVRGGDPSQAMQTQDPLCKSSEKETKPEGTPEHADQGNGGVTPSTPPGPTVSFAKGQVTIEPHNARLKEVIEAIQARTGIAVDFPMGSLDDRVYGIIGPAPLRDALIKLLYGSGLNYIIQTSAVDPHTVKKLVLSAQTRLGSKRDVQVASDAAPEQKEPNVLYGATGFTNEGNGEVIHVEPPAPPPTSASNVPGIPAGFNLKQAAADAHKTPGEILDEMQKHQLEILDAQTPPQ